MKTLLPASRRAAGVLLLSLARLSADTLPLTPGLGTTTGLAGQQSQLTWPAQPGVRYRLEKSTTLAPDGTGAWSTRALVEAKGTTGVWVDPEGQSPRAFYRMPSPGPEVFQIIPPVLSPGGELVVDAQCLPPGSSLVFEIEGQAPATAPLVLMPDGTYRATVSGITAGAIAGIVVAARVVDATGATVVTISQQFEITATGLATLPPPVLPPVIAAILKTKTKSNQSNDRRGSQDCDDNDRTDVLFPNVTGPGQQDRYTGDSHICTAARRGKTSEAKNTIGAIACGARPGAVVLHECDLSLPTPAGPPMEWTRTYTSQRFQASSDAPPQFDFAWNARIVPVPLAAGTSAKRIYLFGGDGRRDVMVRQADGTYTCDGMFRSGKFNADTSFTLTFADQSKMIFCPLVGAPWQGRLGSVLDAAGVAVNCTYTAAGQLNTVTSQFGQSFTCTYGSDGLLSKVADQTGRFVTYTRYAAGESGGSPGDIKNVSCPQVPGQSPLAAPMTYTYTAGNTDDALNHNLLTVRDGENHLLAEFTYSSQSNPAALDYDTCASLDYSRAQPLSGHVTLCKFEAVAPGVFPPGSYRCITNDPRGRVQERVFNAAHCCLSCREYTGFATPGTPVTSTSNRPANGLRPGDPGFFETTWLYNGQHLCTRETLPDGTQYRFTHEYDLNPACPVRERANSRVFTVRSPGGEERTSTCDYLSGFGTPEGVWAGEDGDGGCTERRLPVHNLGSSGQDGVDFYLSKRGYDYYKAQSDMSSARVSSGGGTGASDGIPDPVFASNPIPGVGIVVKRNFGPKSSKREAATGDPGVWAGEDGDGGCTDLARGTNPDGSDCTNKGRPKLGSAMLSSGHIIPIGRGGGSGIGGNLRPGSPIGGLSIKGGRNPGGGHVTRLATSLGEVFTWSYDGSGNCTSSRTPIAGAGCDATYNALGQCTSLTVLNGPGSSFTEQCTYNPGSSWLNSHIVDPAGLHITTTFEADPLGRVIRCVDPQGNDWLTDYNALDCVTRTRSPVTGTAPTASRIACDYFYNRAGQCARMDLEHRDASGALVTANPAYSSFIVWDSRSQVARIATEQRPVSVPTAPPVLDPAPLGIANFAVTDFTYNDAGECVRVSTPAACRGQAEDAVCDYQFDERRLLYRAISGGLGAMTTVTTQLDYDAAGATTAVSLVPSSSAGVPGEPITSTFTWDAFHRLRTCTCPMGSVYVYDYDQQGGVTCSLFGEVVDGTGAGNNVLLSRGRLTVSPACLTFSASPFSEASLDSHFCKWTGDLEIVRERFSPGEPEPHATEVTAVHHSPAGLLMSVSCTGDTRLTNTWDSACRCSSSSDGKVTYSCVRDASGDITSRTRTDLSSVQGVPAKTYTITCTRDVLGRATASTGGGNTVTTAFDSCNRPVLYTNANGVTWRYRWDGDYNDGTPALKPYTMLIEADSDGDGSSEMLRYCHCQSGYCTSSTNSNGYTLSVVYDQLQRPVTWNYPDATHDSCFPDSYGRLATQRHRDGTMTVADFDRDGRLERLSRFGGPGTVPVEPVQYTYNSLRLQAAITAGDSHLTYTWDSLGNQISEMHNGQGVTRTFNPRGRTGITYTDGTRFAESRDSSGQIVSVSAVSSAGVVLSPPVSTVQYAGHRESSETRRNGVVTTWEYRADSDPPLAGGTDDYSFDTCVRTVCTNSAGNAFHSTRVRRDHNQAVTQTDIFYSGSGQSTGRRRLQSWDRLERLTSCTIQRREVAGGPFVNESSVAYTLDLEGRRLTAVGGSNPGVYTQNPASPPSDRQMGQYSSWPGGPLTWDDQGSLSGMSSSAGQKKFVYNAASQLVAVTNAATGEALATYAYDATGRRTRSTVAGSTAAQPPVTTYFIYDGPHCVQELGGDNVPNITLSGSEIGGIGLCVISRNGTTVYPHGGGGHDNSGGGTAFVYPILPAWIEPLKEIEIDDPVLEICRRAGGGGGGGGGSILIDMKDQSLKTVLGTFTLVGCGLKESRAATAVLGFACTAGPAGNLIDRLDGTDGGEPIFLTSEGLPRPGATGTLAGLDWFACGGGSGSKLIWSPRSNLSLYGRYCPESGFIQCGEGIYSPQLGTEVNNQKTKPKSDGSLDAARHGGWDLKANKKV